MIHVSELSWNHQIKNPANHYEIGDDLEAKVKDIDLETERISLSIKDLTEDPWFDIETRYPVGSVVTGRVRNITDFGIFMEIDDGIDGLIHISDISWSKRDRNAIAGSERDQMISARVKDIDIRSKRFSLSIKDLTEDPWSTVQTRYFLGQKVTGKVVSHLEFGIFVEIEDGIDGLVHSIELCPRG